MRFFSSKGLWLNYYKHHIGDYRRDTAHLSLLEHGIYRQLLDQYYLDEKPLPLETESVMRRLSARTDDEKKAVETILKEFFVLQNGWKHKRCELELNDYRAFAETARENGKLGGRPRKTESVSENNPMATETKANHKPITINHKPITNIKPTVASLPDWLSNEVWDSFKKHRGPKFTALAQRLTIKKLAAFKEQGHDPIALLETSIANGWTGIYPEREALTKSSKQAWWASDIGIQAEGARRGIQARPGETMASYKARLGQ